jgi:hypothetical protein
VNEKLPAVSVSFFNYFHLRFHYNLMKIWLGDFSAKVGREDFFKRTIGNENVNKITNNIGVRVVNFTMSKKSVCRNYNVPTSFTWTPPDGNTCNQIDHVLVGRRWHSSVLTGHNFRGLDCETDHYLVVEMSK